MGRVPHAKCCLTLSDRILWIMIDQVLQIGLMRYMVILLNGAFFLMKIQTQQKMRLNPVKITKTMSCLTYALKRSGIELPELTDTADIEKFFVLHPINPGTEELNIEKGTLLLFTQNERVDLVPMEITAAGIIITKPTVILRHVAVYEGCQLISDCGISSKNYPFCKHVRMRKFSEITPACRPTHSLDLKFEYQK